MPRKTLPPVEYTGQTLEELLAFKGTHSLHSLLCAIEEASQLRRSRNPQRSPSAAESVLLAVLAFEREVNNGGFAQFFSNSSRVYAAQIVDALEQTGCTSLADLAARAIACLDVNPVTPSAVLEAMLREDHARDGALEALDQSFYKTPSPAAELLEFVESNRGQFTLEKTFVPPREIVRGATQAGRISLALRFAPHTDFSYAAVRDLAAKLSVENGIGGSEQDLEGGVSMHLFGHAIETGDLDTCQVFGARAFELTWEDTSHCVLHKQWVEKLLAAGHDPRADEAALQYLTRLNAEDHSSRFIRKRVGFFADLIRKHRERLPQSNRFLLDHFQESEITPPLVIYKGLRAAMKAIHGEPGAETPTTKNESES